MKLNYVIMRMVMGIIFVIDYYIGYNVSKYYS